MNIITVSYHSTNYYAIEIKGGKLLVDCGWPGTLPQFIVELKRKGIALNEIKYILVTHFHPDHAGLVQEFKDLGAKLILLDTQIGFIEPLNKLIKTKNVPYTEIRRDDNFSLNFSESREFLNSLGIAGEILATPGHSDDSIALVLDEGFVFTGDLPPRFLVMDDDKTVKESWDKIYHHEITKIYPAHGN